MDLGQELYVLTPPPPSSTTVIKTKCDNLYTMAWRAACTGLACRVSRVRLFSQGQRLRGTVRVHAGGGLAVAPRRLAVPGC